MPQPVVSLPLPAGEAWPVPTSWQWVNWWLLLPLGHLAMLAAMYAALHYAGVVRWWPQSNTLLHWDAVWYQRIRDAGYAYNPRVQSSVAFFPLFPYVWRYSGLGVAGISVLNAGLAAVAAVGLARGLACTRQQALLLASGPLLMFTLVPYSEAFFYGAGALILVGLHRQQRALLVLGLLAGCLTRASGVFLGPALLVAEGLAWLHERDSRATGRTLLLGGLAIGAGLGGALWLQHAYTGEWLGFYKTQRQWGHAWRWPALPLRTSADPELVALALDAIGLAVEVGSVGLLGYLASSQLARWINKKPGKSVNKAVVFALAYCALVAVFTVFQFGGDLCGTGRYVLGTPYFAVLLWAAWRRQADWRIWMLLALAGGLVAGLLGMPFRFRLLGWAGATGYFGLIGGYVAALLVVGGTRRPGQRLRRMLSGGLYALHLVMQCLLLNWFMQDAWLG